MVRPHLVVACLLALGVIVGIVRAIGHDYFGSDPNVIALNVGWGIYSLIFLLAAIAVARETRQVRKTIRIDVDIPVVIHYASELTEEGSSSHGFGYTARALVERRVTSNWFVGAAVDIQQAKDYTPSHALLYVRYSAAGWQGDLDMPPQPLEPYADW